MGTRKNTLSNKLSRDLFSWLNNIYIFYWRFILEVWIYLIGEVMKIITWSKKQILSHKFFWVLNLSEIRINFIGYHFLINCWTTRSLNIFYCFIHLITLHIYLMTQLLYLFYIQHIEVILHYLRKEVKYESNCQYKYSKVNYLFNTIITDFSNK